MGNAVRALPHYTYDDYINWEGKWEVIDGIPYAMSPAPVPKHQRVTNALSAEFHFALKKCRNYTAYQPIDYKVEDDTILQPDMLIVCGDIKKKYLDFPPSLVVEVLSPATAYKDRHLKFSIYESQGIKYYLIISPDTEEAEIYQYQNGAFCLMDKGREITYSFSFEEDCAATIDFFEIW